MGLFNIRVPLQRIIELVAKNKGIGNPTAWASRILKNCEIESDYCTYIFLKSNRNLWYGLKDSIQYLPPFCLFVEQRDTSTKTSFIEYIFYFCQDIHNKRFVDIVRDAYKFNYDNTLDLRLFYMGNPIPLTVYPVSSQQFPSSPLMGKFEYGDKQRVSDPSLLPKPQHYPSFLNYQDSKDTQYKDFKGIQPCKLREYNDLPDTFTISIPLYELCTEILDRKSLEVKQLYTYVEQIEYLGDLLCDLSKSYEYIIEAEGRELKATEYYFVFHEGNMLPYGVLPAVDEDVESADEGSNAVKMPCERIVWLKQGEEYAVKKLVEGFEIPKEQD